MTQENLTPVQQETEDEISLLDLLIVLAKHKRLLIGLPVAFATLALAYGLIAKPVFEAKTTILPPQQQQSSAASMLASLGGLAGGAGAALGIKNPNDLYIAMLQSQVVSNKLIERFKLKDIYEAKTLTDTRKELADNSKIASGKDGLISIAIEDYSPQRAAQIANAYVEELKALVETLKKINEQSERLTRDSEEMENLNRTLTGICKVYEMQRLQASQNHSKDNA